MIRMLAIRRPVKEQLMISSRLAMKRNPIAFRRLATKKHRVTGNLSAASKHPRISQLPPTKPYLTREKQRAQRGRPPPKYHRAKMWTHRNTSTCIRAGAEIKPLPCRYRTTRLGTMSAVWQAFCVSEPIHGSHCNRAIQSKTDNVSRCQQLSRTPARFLPSDGLMSKCSDDWWSLRTSRPVRACGVSGGLILPTWRQGEDRVSCRSLVLRGLRQA